MTTTMDKIIAACLLLAFWPILLVIPGIAQYIITGDSYLAAASGGQYFAGLVWVLVGGFITGFVITEFV